MDHVQNASAPPYGALRRGRRTHLTVTSNVPGAPHGPETRPQTPLTPPDPGRRAAHTAWSAPTGDRVRPLAHHRAGRRRSPALPPSEFRPHTSRNTACAAESCPLWTLRGFRRTQQRDACRPHRCTCDVRTGTPTRGRDHGLHRRCTAGVRPASRWWTKSTPATTSMHGDVTRARRDARPMHERVWRCTARVSACTTRCFERVQEACSKGRTKTKRSPHPNLWQGGPSCRSTRWWTGAGPRRDPDGLPDLPIPIEPGLFPGEAAPSGQRHPEGEPHGVLQAPR